MTQSCIVNLQTPDFGTPIDVIAYPETNFQNWVPNQDKVLIFQVPAGESVGGWQWEGVQNHNDYVFAPVYCTPPVSPGVSFTGGTTLDPVDIGSVSANIFTSEFPVVVIVSGIALGLFLLTWSINKFKNDKTKGL